MIRFILTCAIAIGFVAWQPACAEEPSTEDVVKALVPTKKLRSPRGLTIEGDDKPPSINLYIPFEYDFDKLTTEAMLTLKRLGAALKDPGLVGTDSRSRATRMPKGLLNIIRSSLSAGPRRSAIILSSNTISNPIASRP